MTNPLQQYCTLCGKELDEKADYVDPLKGRQVCPKCREVYAELNILATEHRDIDAREWISLANYELTHCEMSRTSLLKYAAEHWGEKEE